MLMAFYTSYDSAVPNAIHKANGMGGNISELENNTTIKTTVPKYEDDGKIKKSFILNDKNQSQISSVAEYLRNTSETCHTNSSCIADFTTGWNDDSSLQISTTNYAPDTWSKIVGREILVEPNERYQLISHMKLNEWTNYPYLSIEGFNESSGMWIQISTCGYLYDHGPVDWKEFVCSMTVEGNMNKIRPVFVTGWSSQMGKQAITWFDSIYITKFKAIIKDQRLKLELVYEGLDKPTVFTFMRPNTILVLEKDQAAVSAITDGRILKMPLNKKVGNAPEQGMLGIAVSKSEKTFIFLYFTETDAKSVVHNRVYRYEYLNGTLTNPALLLELPAGYYHNGGSMVIAPDNETLYLAVGDVENEAYDIVPHKALNNITGLEPDGSGGILRFNFEGKPVGTGILGTQYPLNLYYAYGIRESFGMDFDPVTGRLWDTENGHDTADEINLLEPGFNGGWHKVQGVWPFHEGHIPNESEMTISPSGLELFNGVGKYHSPQFTWNQTVGPTALTFLDTDRLGEHYKNDMLVADAKNGRIYHFELNTPRNNLTLDGPLKDRIADYDRELNDVIFASGLDLITDMDVGPDGYLYVLTYNEGRIYRIVPIDK